MSSPLQNKIKTQNTANTIPKSTNNIEKVRCKLQEKKHQL